MFGAAPDGATAHEAPNPEHLLEIRGLSKGFALHAARRRVHGCEDVSLGVRHGEFVSVMDNANKLKVRSLIEQLKAAGTTMLGIFHDLEFVEGVCDREYNMQAGDFV